jgi:hypothetical protein
MENPTAVSPEMSKTPRSAMARVVRFIGKSVLALGLALVTFVIAILVFVFATKRFTVPTHQLTKLTQKYLPSIIELKYDSAEINITRPGEHWLTKHIAFETKNFCLRYSGSAVNACFADIRIGLSGGWGGERLEGESKWMPRLIEIDPIVMLGGHVKVDTEAFPKKDPKAKPSQFSIVDLLRKQILPKWKIEGSRIELAEFKLKTASDAYHSKLDLTTLDDGEMLKIALYDFDAESGQFQTAGTIRVRRPDRFQGKADSAQSQPLAAGQAWKVFARAQLNLKKPTQLNFEADADVFDWQSLDVRLLSHFKGVSALREARIAMKLRKSDVNGEVSLKVGGIGSEVRALDFVNCNVDANLDKKTGGVRCGPQAVRLQIRERPLLQRPDLFTFAPRFDLRVQRLEFGDQPAADFAFNLDLDHLGIAQLKTALTGHVERDAKTGMHYSLSGTGQLALLHFAKVVGLLRKTPYSIPAPFNALDGPAVLNAKTNISEKGGRTSFSLQPTWDSEYQALHLRLVGNMDLVPTAKKSLRPVTDATLYVDQIELSAPRLDLAVPPQMAPDQRFHQIQTAAQTAAAKATPRGIDFKLHVLTTRPQAVKITTNLTKTVVPLDFDVHYENSSHPARGIASSGDPQPVPTVAAPTSVDQKDRAVVDQKTPAAIDSKAPASTFVQTPAVLDAKKPAVAATGPVAEPGSGTGAAIITGWVQIGQTELDLFRRNAKLEKMRVEFLANGKERVDGRASVHYLEYDIAMLFTGDVSHPGIKFISRPYLEQRQVIGVLLFGRPMDELSDQQKQSVAGLQAALADAALGVGSLYLLANTPIESVGYDPQKQSFTATVGLGGGASIEVGSSADIGFRKTLSREFVFRSDVERLGATGERTVSALIEWVKGF